MTGRALRVRRPPDSTQATVRYARWMRALFEQWRAGVEALAARGPLERNALQALWSHLTEPTHLRPMLLGVAQTVELDLRRYYTGVFRRPPPRVPAPEHARAAWVTEQLRLLKDVGEDQISRLVLLPYAPPERADAKASVTRAVNKARKANVALIGGTDLAQHTKLVELFKRAQSQGVRHEDLVAGVRAVMGIGQNRAKLIARDQTVKHNAASNRAQAEAAGVTEYTWRITKDDSCRPMHKALEGTVHRYDNPPVTNKQGDRNNPGGDYNCRCLAQPIIKPVQSLFADLADPEFAGLGF